MTTSPPDLSLLPMGRNGTTSDTNTPVQVGTATNWSPLATGGHVSGPVRTDGTFRSTDSWATT